LRRWFNVEVRVLHHEVATAGQVEVNFEPGSVTSTADRLQTLKYAARMTAYTTGLTATFMPKPLAGDNGSGLHIHVSLWRGEYNIFYDEADRYAELSQEARYFIGGILEHASSLAAITNPTVNSYRRLVPGYEAPVYVAWGRSDRSAMVRLPVYHGSRPEARRIEVRSPEPSSNPYLALPAVVLAGLDGIRRKIEPGDPVDRNLYSLTRDERRRLGVGELPRSPWEALDALESDHSWLLPAFPRGLVEAYIDLKRGEARRLAGIPSPSEAYYYLGA
ncbi:MAG: type I glutamate--ammonia ligase, partial [Candidatus Korarchaeota archaeon]|nr:type I glutamate--ammonia ligase [Candidatus Korarchaeota archaeon]